MHSVRMKEERVKRLKDQLQAGSLQLPSPHYEAIQALQTQVLAEQDHYEEALQEAAQLTQLFTRTAAALVEFMQAVCKKQTLDLQLQSTGVARLRTAVLSASEKAGFVAQEGRFEVEDKKKGHRVQQAKRTAHLGRLHGFGLASSRSVESLTLSFVSHSAHQLRTLHRTASAIAGVERSVQRNKLATQRQAEACSQFERLKSQAAALAMYHLYRHAGPLHEPLSDEDVHTVSEYYRDLTAEHGTLTQRYLHLVDEATQLQRMQAALRSEYLLLKEQDSSECWEKVRQDCESAGLGCTFNQIVTGEASVDSQDCENLERTALRCFVQITDLTKRVLQSLQGVAKYSGDSSLSLSRDEDSSTLQTSNDKTDRRLRKSMTMQSPVSRKVPKRSFEPLPESPEPLASGSRTTPALLFIRHFVGADARWSAAALRRAHAKCKQQTSDLGRQFLDLAVELVRAEAKAKTTVSVLAEQSEAELSQRQKGARVPLELDTQALLRTVFSWKYDSLAKARSKRWVEIEEIVAGYKVPLQLPPTISDSPTLAETESEELEQSLLHTERLLIKQRSLPSLRQPTTPKAQSLPTSPRQTGIFAELKSLRAKVALVRRLGKR